MININEKMKLYKVYRFTQCFIFSDFFSIKLTKQFQSNTNIFCFNNNGFLKEYRRYNKTFR